MNMSFLEGEGGKDSVVECLADQDRVITHISYNGDHENEIISAAESADMLRDVQMAVTDGYLHCQFLRKMSTSGESRVYDLEQDWYLLLAQGLVDNGRKARHERLPLASARLVDLQSLDDVGPWTQDKLFIKIHGSVMAFAWIFCAGFGIVMARFTKPLWPAHKLCGRKVWFTVHRLCMILLGVLTLFGFILVFVEAEGLAHISAKEFQKLHPIVGIIITVFTVTQIVFGLFRPSADSKNRPVFNWGHWMLGMACQLLAVFNMALGLKLRKSGVHVSGPYILYAYAMYQVIMVIVLEIITCNIRIKERKQASYVIYERRNTIYSSTKEIMEGEANEPPGSIALRIAVRIHLLCVTAFAAALIALICIAH
nr:hypothetical protein BaRGS_020320 [Batillaria attramentaria]